ncbi:unnamed protein product [Bursaphelenchus okinawaensis]|uniref:Guanylate cyclase n=1 Tax=Bursaphelenchus okinawaensis TaxID=465554 RepID=A0A811LQ21_9BILA|nr:unnamed protein product [Bursaphelenchus okinawaensis]CAG9126835.1 unnamed protein product [Bursaphelenchus okinawaensis]
MPKAEDILDMCKTELKNEGILNDDFNIEILSQTGCGESYEGVAVAADMYHQQNVKVFVGPYCAAEMDAVSKMAAFWDIPIIGYMASNTAFSDKTIYKTMARVSLRTINSLALATFTTLKHYDWKKVAIVTNSGTAALERVVAFQNVFHNNNIQVLRKFMLEESATAKQIVASGIMEEIKHTTRVLICVFSSTRDMTKEFMQAVRDTNMKTTEYVVIMPWLQAESKDLSPWITLEGQTLQNVKDMFDNTIIIDDVNGFDNGLMTPFKERVEANGINIEELNLLNIYGYIHLYDALKLYALSATKAIKETNDVKVITNGTYIWNTMRKMTFPGLVNAEGISSGTVIMDDLAERAAVYAAFFVSAKQEIPLRMIDMNPKFIPQCDGLKTKTGCMELQVKDVSTGFWPSINGRVPADEPECGFRNEKCDYTLIIIIGALALLVIVVTFTMVMACRVMENNSLSKNSWRIFRDEMRIVSTEEMKSMLSIGSSKTKLSNMSKFAKHHAIIGTNTHASFHVYPQRRPIQFNREDLQLLTNLKLAVHDNLNPFLGMSFNEKEEMIVLWKFCSRGTVQDVIYNEEVSLDEKFHAAFVRDITLGLEYLHLSVIGYHGSLTPWSCLIDRNWMVKLTDYGVANPIERWEKQGAITKEQLKEDEEKSGAIQATNDLYRAPEMLQMAEFNKRRGMEQTWKKQTANRLQAGDVYAFGMVMYEILFRALPFPENTNINELCEYVRDGSKSFKPSIQDKSKVHPDIASLLQDCWSNNPEIRPSVRRVRLNTENYLKVKGSLVDQMMRMMEQYANNLEKLVQERTGMLEEANQRADKLLSQLLPSYVSNELKLGRAVLPKTFRQASVFFSDIVGFTTLCSNSTPLEVVTMLNTVYTGFDDIIAKHKAYKVETIGDAYMVVSGIPQENGTRHLMNLSDVSLEIMVFLKTYVIPHRKDKTMVIRIGLHTGQVAAGVVGLTAPRYCLFGDTVNTASRMESTGSPGKIQISEAFKIGLDQYYPEFETSLRGEFQIKGKGKMNTYWLDGKRRQDMGSQMLDAHRQMNELGI